ncbi:hypothetical protein ASG50_14000 [Rhizobium sp. Leaf386]|nr:hypothetical protein ASG50_14000 [Rhizobium sp. Leaf386]
MIHGLSRRSKKPKKAKFQLTVRSYQPRVLTPPNVLPTRAKRLERERFQTAKTKAYRQAAASARRSAALLQGATLRSRRRRLRHHAPEAELHQHVFQVHGDKGLIFDDKD